MAQKGYKGMGMEGPVAAWYARNTNDERRHRQVAERLVGKIPAGGRVLEIAPGPGYFAIELSKLGHFEITGLDISQSFVEIARRNASRAGASIDFRLGNASAMPFPDQSFDFAFCQAAFKNFSEPVKAIAEMHRVLRPQGQAVIIDLRRDASVAEIDHYVTTSGMGGFSQLFTKWTFRSMLLKRAYTLPQMEAFVRQTPFHSCRIETDDIGFTLWLTRQE